MSDTNPKVDGYIRKNKRWQAEMQALREILLDSPLSEDFKWWSPCYTTKDGNIVIMHVFKHYCALLFFKGALMKDEAGILVQQTKNVQSARQLRFTSADEIVEMAHIIKAYISEAIEIEKAGLEVELKSTAEFEMPEAFQAKLDEMPELKAAFEALTPGRQRGYLLYLSGAKRAATREARVAKCIPDILEGKGLND